jgi:hypothetical protein
MATSFLANLLWPIFPIFGRCLEKSKFGAGGLMGIGKAGREGQLGEEISAIAVSGGIH